MVPSMTVEQSRTMALAEEYRGRGYEVIVEPSGDQLPEFLAGYQPDLIARHGPETLVVEVKSRRSLASDKKVRELARRVRSHPGWSFELVLVGDDTTTSDTGRSLQRSEILQGIGEAERVEATGSTRAVLLVAWALAEAAVRLLMREQGVELQRLTPASVLKQAVGEGLITRSDYELMVRAMEHRNAVAHGFQPPEPEPSLHRELLQLTERLLAEE